jgi:hypothetical protein
VNVTAWASGLEVTGGGTGVVSHAGVGLVRRLSDKTGLTRGLLQALFSGRLVHHDRGRVLADISCVIADGARAVSDFRVLADQGEAFGQVASVPTAYRTLEEITRGARMEKKLIAAVSAARRYAWAQVVARHGTLPGVRVADKALPGVTGLLREGPGGDQLEGWPEPMRIFARRERPHPGARLSLSGHEDGYRYQLWVTNLPATTKGWRGQNAYIDAGHRGHARVEDCIRTGKQTGIGRFPSRDCKFNQAWLTAAMIAQILLAWLKLLALDGDLAKAEPRTLRYRVLHAAARLVRGERRRRWKFPASWPWAEAITRAWQRICALPDTC